MILRRVIQMFKYRCGCTVFDGFVFVFEVGFGCGKVYMFLEGQFGFSGIQCGFQQFRDGESEFQFVLSLLLFYWLWFDMGGDFIRVQIWGGMVVFWVKVFFEDIICVAQRRVVMYGFDQNKIFIVIFWEIVIKCVLVCGIVRRIVVQLYVLGLLTFVLIENFILQFYFVDYFRNRFKDFVSFCGMQFENYGIRNF